MLPARGEDQDLESTKRGIKNVKEDRKMGYPHTRSQTESGVRKIAL